MIGFACGGAARSGLGEGGRQGCLETGSIFLERQLEGTGEVDVSEATSEERREFSGEERQRRSEDEERLRSSWSARELRSGV